MDHTQALQLTVRALTQTGKGILAADESVATIAKRFAAVGIECNERSRRDYRSLLLSTHGLGQFISGVILHEETLGQTSNEGIGITELVSRAGMVPGIKVDRGTQELAHAPGDKITAGLDDLAQRLHGYAEQGARFAKWRAVYRIGAGTPSVLAISANAEVLARYAACCQEQGLVPIVEPEVLIDGDHSMARCAYVTEQVLAEVVAALRRHSVQFETMLLKPNMVLPGLANGHKALPELVAHETVAVLRRTLPAAVPGVHFLSGGQSPEQACANLNAMNALYPHAPWALSFSYARALQEPAMASWRGLAANREAAQQVFYRRAELAAAARDGRYQAELEVE